MGNEWTKKPLRDLLSDDQIQRVTEILNSNVDELQKTQELKTYLGQFKEELQAKGVLPDFLSYSLIHTYNQIRRGN